MVRYLERNSNVTFEIAPTPDYSAGEEGWKTGRTLVPLKFDARQLGDYADLVRPHIPEIGLFSSMQIPFAEYRKFIGWRNSVDNFWLAAASRSEEHTSELQSLMRISYAVFCLKKKNHTTHLTHSYLFLLISFYFSSSSILYIVF